MEVRGESCSIPCVWYSFKASIRHCSMLIKLPRSGLVFLFCFVFFFVKSQIFPGGTFAS